MVPGAEERSIDEMFFDGREPLDRVLEIDLLFVVHASECACVPHRREDESVQRESGDEGRKRD